MAYDWVSLRHKRALVLGFGVLLLLTATSSSAQVAPVTPANVPGVDGLNQYPGLLDEFGRLFTRFQRDVQFPPARNHSNLLPLLPESTNFYLALPNYGEASHQVLTVFHQELQQNASLRQWWTSGDMAKNGPKFEDALNRFSQISQYLGDEIVLSGSIQEKTPRVLIVSEIRKPGLKPVLEQMIAQVAAQSKGHSGIRLVNEHDLTNAAPEKQHKLLVLIRPEIVAAASDVATLQAFNSRFNQHSREFASNPFAGRILQSYDDGVTTMGAADVHAIVSQIPDAKSPKAAMFEHSGFADMKYLVWEHKTVSGKSISQAELSFTGPRHGMAAWLGSPVTPGSLDFVSPKAILVATLVLNRPEQMFNDIRQLSSSNPAAAAQLAQAEQALGISFKDDLFAQLSGEITIELDNPAPPQPAWRAILRVKDPQHLQRTLAAIFAAGHIQPEQYEESGITYYAFQAPAGKTPVNITFAFADGYLVLGSSSAVEEAVRLHRFGGSLAKSSKFLAALPPGHKSGVSALFYQDPVAMMKFRLQQLAPAAASPYSQLAHDAPPTVVCFYGEPTAITEASTSAAADAGAVLIAAAVAIPNLMRSRIAANETSALAAMHSLHNAQAAYAAAYSDRGFAPDLTALGPDPKSPNSKSPDHAGLIDASLAGATCSGQWCEVSGYRFSVKAVCGLGTCSNYVAVATPVLSSSASRSFCSTADGVIRYRLGPLASPPHLFECRSWTPLK